MCLVLHGSSSSQLFNLYHKTAPCLACNTTVLEAEKPVAKLGNQDTFVFPFCPSIMSDQVLSASQDLNCLFVYETRVLPMCRYVMCIHRYAHNMEVLNVLMYVQYLVLIQRHSVKKIDFSFGLFTSSLCAEHSHKSQ